MEQAFKIYWNEKPATKAPDKYKRKRVSLAGKKRKSA
jgi:hypothetical protein